MGLNQNERDSKCHEDKTISYPHVAIHPQSPNTLREPTLPVNHGVTIPTKPATPEAGQ